MIHPALLDATRQRRACTGESHQALTALHRAGIDIRTIAAAEPEQADLEAAVTVPVCRIGIQAAHPLGIISVHPEPHRLTLRLTPRPYVVRLWAEALLPTRAWDAHTRTDPRDRVSGVYGLRWHTTASAVHLHRPHTPGLLRLRGFPVRWWPRAAAAVASSRGSLITVPGWTADEDAAEAGTRGTALRPTNLLSPLLRRIRATSGTGAVQATDAWAAFGGLRLETMDGPPCAQMARLLGPGPCGLGWTVGSARCACDAPGGRDGCVMTLHTSDGQQTVSYNGQRSPRTPADLAALAAEGDRRAFA
ncbi:hypothetical protein ADK60_02370 [Streptomyces sp. XY431]|uniref:hypothetical protein n=1 Tax=Streptomyces sp. XY431 TaxID=1415562 RepID=UPI0006AEA154|nr:hypothetical protein [Streptomyces sp. XY431]KOV38379.1 hypothetical protein ADK60_02370 [Streptomyces sp. XY431]